MPALAVASAFHEGDVFHKDFRGVLHGSESEPLPDGRQLV